MDEAALKLVQQMLTQQGPALELYARQWCHAPEDVVQEALLRLAEQRPIPDRPVAWLYRAVRRGALSAARGDARRQRHETAAALPAEWFECDVGLGLDAEVATAALEELPLAEREVVVTRLWGELSFQEIGDLVGCSSSAAQRRYVAALAALRERFGVRCSATKDCPKS
ncbi:MAG: sigma-70 family RNA polymerase sigma factor [Pirellulales bacterium]|nr:sigma-70 family RNA polymerase sigma factor [Pirellulales bacterium]